jgi:hypothetical protein
MWVYNTALHERRESALTYKIDFRLTKGAYDDYGLQLYT